MSERAEHIKKLNGHSGCEVDLFKGQSGYFITKTSPGLGYDARLIRQAEKQERLQALIPVPRVLKTQFEVSPVSYDMDYVHGMDFRQACLARPMPWITTFMNTLVSHLETLNATDVKADLPARFHEKIDVLDRQIRAHQSDYVRDLQRQTGKLLDYDFSDIKATECHGDLTLENIIFKSDGEISFIDVLDGDLESFWMDLAKISFDVEIFWSLRTILWPSNHGADERFLSTLCRYLGDELKLGIKTHFPDALKHIAALKAIQALRIIPYSQYEQTTRKLADYVANLDI